MSSSVGTVTKLQLKQWRESRSISLQDIAQVTKLSVRSLEAIEAGEFSKLPGGIYTTSYIRQYARAIGYAEHELLTRYKEAS